MMANKQKEALATLMFCAMLGGGVHPSSRKIAVEKKDIKKPIPKGCREYSFFGVTVIALNERTAIRKCQKKAENKLEISDLKLKNL